MSNHYADGVDLRVSEKYRVPPRISLPRDVIDHVCSDHYKQLTADTETGYDFNLERNVIHKITEWQRVHDQTENDRQEALRARDRERRQLMEQQQKHLLNQVSYPSTDDLSSDDGEGASSSKAGSASDSSAAVQKAPEARPVVAIATSAPHMQSDFSTILKPTVVPDSTVSGGGGGGVGQNLESAFVSQNERNNRTTNGQHKMCPDFNYSEWESDNHNPFDRMELKSINDLDILAQVLHTTQLARKQANYSPAPKDENKEEELSVEATPSPPTSPVNTVEDPPGVDQTKPNDGQPEKKSEQNNHIETNGNSWEINGDRIPATSVPLTQQQPVNGTTTSTETFQNYPTTTTNSSMVYQEYGQVNPSSQNYQQFVPGHSGISYFNNHLQQTQHNQSHQYHSNIPTYSFHPQFNVNYNHFAADSPVHLPTTNHHQQQVPLNGPIERTALDNTNASGSSLLRSRSKSVPDIVNELEEEVRASEQRRRVRNHSQSYKVVDDDDEEEEEEAVKESAFDRLPNESKELALKISKMGFPVDVVATVIEQLGNDDKKIIEHLIPLSELLDLGFGVSPTSEALLKFNNNRERALDFLIS